MQKRHVCKFDGWLVINKEVGMSSAKVVNKVKKIMKIKKAGHAGTLDPLASGVLPVAIGEATKTMKYATHSEKSYEFDINWGVETETDDLEGKILFNSDIRPSKSEIINALPAFTGKTMQKPPSFSAIKIDGVRSYKLWRTMGRVQQQLGPVQQQEQGRLTARELRAMQHEGHLAQQEGGGQ